jgi:hypothetical protein
MGIPLYLVRAALVFVWGPPQPPKGAVLCSRSLVRPPQPEIIKWTSARCVQQIKNIYVPHNKAPPAAAEKNALRYQGLGGKKQAK